jgi:hypothetical protein
VALLEAGGQDDAPEIDMPVAFPQLLKTKYNWDFATEPKQGLGERRIYLPRGRMLGGCSAMNAMIYIRGNAADFDGWADEGALGWSHSECNDCGVFHRQPAGTGADVALKQAVPLKPAQTLCQALLRHPRNIAADRIEAAPTTMVAKRTEEKTRSSRIRSLRSLAS